VQDSLTPVVGTAPAASTWPKHYQADATGDYDFSHSSRNGHIKRAAREGVSATFLLMDRRSNEIWRGLICMSLVIESVSHYQDIGRFFAQR